MRIGGVGYERKEKKTSKASRVPFHVCGFDLVLRTFLILTIWNRQPPVSRGVIEHPVSKLPSSFLNTLSLKQLAPGR